MLLRTEHVENKVAIKLDITKVNGGLKQAVSGMGRILKTDCRPLGEVRSLRQY